MKNEGEKRPNRMMNSRACKDDVEGGFRVVCKMLSVFAEVQVGKTERC